MARHPLAARPTMYRGTLMRSRLEASVTAILDQLDISWRYEPCCFADGPEQYLPDFQLWPDDTAHRWYLEVKPASVWGDWPAPDDSEVALTLARMEVIRASDPASVLALWTPDQDCGCGGRLVTNWPDHPDYEGWSRLAGAQKWLATHAAHMRGEHKPEETR